MIDKEILKYNEKLVDTLQKKKWVCFGAGFHCYEFLKNFCVDQKILPLPAYACDNNKSRWGQKILSVPICSPTELDKENPSDCVIVVTATESCGIMAELFLGGKGKYYFEIVTINQLDSYLTFVNHGEEFLTVYDRLEDERSKKNFAGVLSGCIAGNINFPMFYTQNPYWDNDVVGILNDNDVVIIGGAYDGKHIDRALASNPTVTVHGFEPDENVFGDLRNKYKNNPNVIIHNYALYDKEEPISLDTAAYGGAKVVNESTITSPKRGGVCVQCRNGQCYKFRQSPELC